MKKYVLLAVFLCFGCQTYQERIEEYRARCSYIYGYQNPDATAFCIQNLEAQDNRAQRERLREMERDDERRDREQERRDRRQEADKRDHMRSIQEYKQWERETEKQLNRNADEYRKKYGSTAESMIQLDRSTFEMQKAIKKPVY